MGCWLPKITRKLTRLGNQTTQNKLQHKGQNDAYTHTHTHTHIELQVTIKRTNKIYKPWGEGQINQDEILNIINEKSNLRQQINHRINWEETHYPRENRNQSEINIGTAIHFLFFFLIY